MHLGFAALFTGDYGLEGVECAEGFFVQFVPLLHHEQGVVVVAQVVVLVFVIGVEHQVDGLVHVLVALGLVALVVDHLSQIEEGNGVHGLVSGGFCFVQQEIDTFGFPDFVVQAVVGGDKAVELIHIFIIVLAYGVTFEGTAIVF
ncbi:hypothetical protein [Bacteroides cellulosilyticus]|uniref:hypothetical protein n=1 Tax=Bacteroides cellulosilyticus TaxID=246787 RepID=UPI001921FFC4|nr:hypothetical protein [Bacteroides cellulosilyticus]